MTGKRLPIVLRLMPAPKRNQAPIPTAFLPACPWGPETLGAYSEALGWHEAGPSDLARGRPLENGEDREALLRVVQKEIGAGVSLMPISRVGEATHKARIGYARQLMDEERG